MELTIKEKLGIIIKNTRKHKKISQSELSKRISFSQSIISKIENGYDIIPLDNYEVALKNLDLYYDFGSQVEAQVISIIEQISNHYVNLDIDQINKLVIKFESLMPNIIYYYDFLICEFVLSFVQLDFADCYLLQEQIEPLYDICQHQSKAIYDHVKVLLEKLNEKNIQNHEIIKLNSSITSDGLNHYYNGLIHFYSFNLTIALNNLLKAHQTFLANHKINRAIRSELLINFILMKENAYHDIEIRCSYALNHHTSNINKFDLHMLKFQLAYSLYYQNKTEEALTIFESLEKISIIDVFTPYMIDKCLLKLKKFDHFDQHYDEINKYNCLYFLLNQRKNDNRNKEYFKIIEHFIIPYLARYFFIKEFQVYTLELLSFYIEQRKYKKYKKLADQLTVIYNIL